MCYCSNRDEMGTEIKAHKVNTGKEYTPTRKQAHHHPVTSPVLYCFSLAIFLPQVHITEHFTVAVSAENME